MPILTDEKIKLSVVLSVIITVMLLFVLTIGGTVGASLQRCFSIYTEGTKTYAVVYTSGSTRYMEEATISGGSIEIDTTKQRVITSDDITYDIEVFEEVSVIRIESEAKLDAHPISMQKFFETIGSVFESLMDKIEEMVAKDEGSIPGTECQPTAGD